MDFIGFISKIASNPAVSLILSLLLFFQWDRQYAKEQSVKNNLLAMKRIIDAQNTPESKVLGEMLDATLATIGARSPFQKEGKRVLSFINEKFEKISNSEIKQTVKEEI